MIKIRRKVAAALKILYMMTLPPLDRAIVNHLEEAQANRLRAAMRNEP